MINLIEKSTTIHKNQKIIRSNQIESKKLSILFTILLKNIESVEIFTWWHALRSRLRIGMIGKCTYRRRFCENIEKGKLIFGTFESRFNPDITILFTETSVCTCEAMRLAATVHTFRRIEKTSHHDKLPLRTH